jgi:hypothetical protein
MEDTAAHSIILLVLYRNYTYLRKSYPYIYCSSTSILVYTKWVVELVYMNEKSTLGMINPQMYESLTAYAGYEGGPLT